MVHTWVMENRPMPVSGFCQRRNPADQGKNATPAKLVVCVLPTVKLSHGQVLKLSCEEQANLLPTSIFKQQPVRRRGTSW